jgi:pyruvate dehydrogenase E2 component (dihydrolipoamide acetyltransferase)
MLSFLTDIEIDLIIGVVSLVAGVLFSTKIKDTLKGVPSDLRTALNSVEADAVAKIKAAKAATPVAVKKPSPAAAALVAASASAVATAAPAAPAPAAPPAAPAA